MKNYKLTHKEFVSKSKIVHNNFYEYSITKYVKNSKKIDIICPEHGLFKQNANSHLLGNGCSNCAGVIQKTTEEFISESKLIHNDLYEYNLVEYTNNVNNVKIICKKHGIFKQQPSNHLMGKGCSKCKTSKGENKILEYLTSKNIKYIHEHKFDDLKHKYKLKFDFYLPLYNLCIEYDGKQHFESIKFFGGEENFKKQKLRDELKNQYCIDNNINLLRIPYYDYNKIENILNIYL